jgi:hypothetical protein
MIDPWTLFYCVAFLLVAEIPIGMIVGYWIVMGVRRNDLPRPRT